MGREGEGGRLRAARLARGWTLEDVAIALHQLDGELGEPESRVDLNHVSKWERGVRSPGRRYQARLCLVFDALPAQLGFAETPTLMRDLGDLRWRRLKHDVPAPASLDRERLAATIRHLWPADQILVDGLTRAGRELAARTDTGPAAAVLPDLQTYLEEVHVLLGRPQRELVAVRLKVLASTAAQHAAFLSDSLGLGRHAYALSAEAELLAREADERNRLAEVLVDRAEQLSRRARGPEERGVPITLAEAARLALGDEAPAGLRGWVLAQGAADLSAQGDDLLSGRRLEAAYRATAGASASEVNLFSEYESAWLESYRGLRALHLGHGAEAREVFESVLARTDRRLLWERSRALYRLGWALALEGEVERASELLREAVEVTAGSGDRRGLAAAVRVREQQLGRWRTDPAVRRLDEAIRLGARSTEAR
jgi:transcriptional regulator with XRE-family HTH domain/tetratricopeptide (TPR) repeat protein